MNTTSQPILLSSVPKGSHIKRRNSGRVDFDPGITERLITDNYAFVVHLSSKYRNKGVDPDDLFQEGQVALIRAVTSPNFDPDKGSLVAYSGRAICNEMQRAIDSQSRTIRLTSKPINAIRSVAEAADRLAQTLGRNPTHEEIAMESGLSLSEVFEANGLSMRPGSIDKTFSDSDFALSSAIPDENCETDFVDIDNVEMFEALSELMDDILDVRQKEILIQKFGLRDENRQGKSFEEIAEIMGLSRQGVNNIYDEAINLISNHPRFKDLFSVFSPDAVQGSDLNQPLNNSLQFLPCTALIKGESTVYFRNGKTITIKYNPKHIPNIKTSTSSNLRSEVKLTGVNPVYVRKAKLIADVIIEEVSCTISLKKRYDVSTDLAEREQIKKELVTKYPLYSKSFVTGKSTNTERFLCTYNKVLDSLVRRDETLSEFRNSKALEALVAYFCIRPEGEVGFNAFPTKFIDENAPDFIEKIQILGRYYLVNLQKIDTADKVEKFDKWADDEKGLLANNLSILGKSFSPPELLRVVFPGFLDPVHNVHPVIREEKIEYCNKWTSKNPRVKELYTLPVQAAFENKGLVKSDNTVDLQRVQNTDWSHIFIEEGYFPGGAFREGSHLRSFFDAIELAVPGIFQAIPKYKFRTLNKWSSENRLKTIDEITEYIVEKKLKLVTESGEVSPKKIRSIRNWAAQYQQEYYDCINLSGIGSAYNALRRKYPKIFGWDLHKIDPADIRTPGMWVGAEGEKLFRLKFAKSLAIVFQILKSQNPKQFKGISVKFNPAAETPITVCGADLRKLLEVYREHDISWQDHIKQFRLFSPYVDLIGQNMQEAFTLLLGAVDPVTNCFGDSDIQLADIKRISNGKPKQLNLTPIQLAN